MAVRQVWDIRRVLVVLSRWWWWPTLTISASLFGAWLYLRYTVATYRSEATIQIDPKQSFAGSLANTNEGSLISIDIISEKYLELFTDFEVIREVVEKGNHHIEFYSVGQFGTSLIYPLPVELEILDKNKSILPYAARLAIEILGDTAYTLLRNDEVGKTCRWGDWIEWEGTWLRLRLKRPLMPGRYMLSYVPIEQAAASWASRVLVVPKRGFTVLSLMVADVSPQRAQAFCKELLQAARSHEQSVQQEYYDKVIAYIDTLLASVLMDIDRVQDTIRKVESLLEVPLLDIRSKVTLDKYQDYSKEDFSIKYEALDNISKQIKVVSDYLDRQVDTIPFLVIPAGLDEFQQEAQRLNENIKAYNALSRSYALSSVYVREFVRKMKIDISFIEKSIQLQKKLMLIQREYAKKYLSAGLPRLYQDVDSKRRLDLVNFNWESKKKVYEMLIERRLQVGIERAGVSSLIRVTQPPTLPIAPLSPNRIQVYVVLLLLGAVVGVGGIFLREMITQKISYRQEIEPISPVTVIGEMPALHKREKQYEIGIGYLSSLQLEVLRSFRNSLDFLWDKEGPKVAILTSTVSGEGKTYLSSALAYIYALAGRKVLLVDADLRRAQLTQLQGLMQRPGLSTLLASDLEIIRNGAFAQQPWVNFLLENLYLLPSGPLPPNAAELLASSRLRDFVLSLQDEFEYFIFDTSPVGLVPDALSILSHFPEAVVLYVFRADYSRVNFLNHLEDIVKQHRLKKVYLLFNGTKTHRPHYGYGYGYGYYGSGYGASRYYYAKGHSSWAERVRKWIPL